VNGKRESDGAESSSGMDSAKHRAACNSPAIFAPDGDADRARVYRCTGVLGHGGLHHDDGLTWGGGYPAPEPERIAAAEAGRLREYDAAHPVPRVLS
jgi:hypothetical protein